jgi:hypothetical protein
MFVKEISEGFHRDLHRSISKLGETVTNNNMLKSYRKNGFFNTLLWQSAKRNGKKTQTHPQTPMSTRHFFEGENHGFHHAKARHDEVIARNGRNRIAHIR